MSQKPTLPYPDHPGWPAGVIRLGSNYWEVNEDKIEAARRGEPQAWEFIYTELAPALRGFAYARGARDPDAVVGQAFLNAVEGIKRFRGDFNQFRSWMFKIVRARVIDESRRAANRLETPTQDMSAAGSERAPSAEDTFMAEVTDPALLDAISALPDAQRDTLLLRIIADQSIAETALILGKRPGTVKVLLHRALQGVRRNLSGEAND